MADPRSGRPSRGAERSRGGRRSAGPRVGEGFGGPARGPRRRKPSDRRDPPPQRARLGRESELETAAPAGGTGSISGRVKSEKGEPIAGVLVRAEYQGDRDQRPPEWKLGDGIPPEQDDAATVQSYVEDVALTRSMRRDGRDRREGRVHAHGPPRRPVFAQRVPEGLVDSTDQREFRWSARPGVFAEFTANASSSSRSTCACRTARSRSGLGPHQRPEQHAGRGWAPEQRRPAARAGSYSDQRDRRRPRGVALRAQNVVLKEGGPHADPFRLKARTGIHGRVNVPKGLRGRQPVDLRGPLHGNDCAGRERVRSGQNGWASHGTGTSSTSSTSRPERG